MEWYTCYETWTYNWGYQSYGKLFFGNKMKNMKFEEIFEQEGLYVADGFKQGVAFEIKKNSITNHLELFLTTYEHKDDLLPIIEDVIVYAGLFKKDYKKVFTRQSLFKDDDEKEVFEW